MGMAQGEIETVRDSEDKGSTAEPIGYRAIMHQSSIPLPGLLDEKVHVCGRPEIRHSLAVGHRYRLTLWITFDKYECALRPTRG